MRAYILTPTILFGLLHSTTLLAQSEPTSEPVFAPSTATPATPPPTPTAAPPVSSGNNRPAGTTVAIGVGFTFPADLTVPNTVSARLRLASGLAIEPIVIFTLENSEDVIEDVVNNITITNQIKDETLTLAAAVRYPLASRGPVDLVIQGVPAITLNTVVVDPDGADNETTTQVRQTIVNWGFGLEWFLPRNISLSLDAINPLLVITDTEVTDEQNQVNVDSNDVLFGAIFAPTVRLLFHLYF